MEKRWNVEPRMPDEASKALSGYSPVLRKLLYNRNIYTPEAAAHYLSKAPPEGCHALALHGMQAAVERIQFAIQSGEQIAVYGDYDVDGVTSTALLTQVLTRLGASARPYIPNRFEEGYGLNNDALSVLHEEGVSLVITVDCGVRSLKEVEHARTLGLDMIITDHHMPGDELPNCHAVINPKQSGCDYPFKDLAGVGLAYKLADALIGKEHPDLSAAEFLDLVALGTVADLAPLTGENRSLVAQGLEGLRDSRRQGVLSLIQVAGVKSHLLTASDIGFGLGPRLNASGRLESALASLQLLLTDNLFEAGRLAQQLQAHNVDRQRLTKATSEEAERLALARYPNPLLLFAASPEFNSGVVGLAASRLLERHYRPSIVCHQDDEFTVGSCRSIDELDINKTIDEADYDGLLERHGGHHHAAGFKIRTERLPLFLERMDEIVYRELAAEDLRPLLHADLEIDLDRLFSELRNGLMDELDLLQPTGKENAPAVFVSREARVSNPRLIGQDKSHLKMRLSTGKAIHEAVAWRQAADWSNGLPLRVDVMYTVERNYFNDQETLQLVIKDIKESGSPD